MRQTLCERIWRPTGGHDARLKKRIDHAVIQEVGPTSTRRLAIVLADPLGRWHSYRLPLPRRRCGQRSRTSQDIITALRQLVLVANDDLIAGILNRNRSTGHGNRWTRSAGVEIASHESPSTGLSRMESKQECNLLT